MIALAEAGPRDLPARHPAASGFALALAFALACRSQSAGGFGEAARSAGEAGWEAGAEGEANPLRVSI
jgi:hypothetical protein